MKKEYGIGLVLLLLVVIGGVSFALKSKTKTAASKQLAVAPTQSSEAFTSIQDALSKSISLSCSFTDDTGRQMQSFIKNGAMRVNITAKNPQESGSSIIKDKKIYFWNTTNAIMMNMPEITPGVAIPSQGSAENKGASTTADIMNSMEKFKKSCVSAVIDDSDFIPPSDIKFTDFSKMMVPSGIPAASTGDTSRTIPSINPQNYQQMMQKYGQQYQQK